MKYRLITVITSILLLTVSPGIKYAMAYTMIGNGHRSCGGWTEDRNVLRMTPKNEIASTMAFSHMTWVLGFLSGMGFMGNGMDPLGGIDREAVAAWIDKYCRDHPLESIAEAAGTLAVIHSRK